MKRTLRRTMTGARRGLTLLEVVLATVLVTAVAAACWPLVREATRAAEHREPVVSGRALEAFADAFLEDPVAFGVPEEDLLLGARTRPWPDATGDRSPVLIRGLAAADPEADHAWLVFQCGETVVLRWVVREPEELIGGRP